ncbi:MAG: sugar O-acyltransferase (sialic acid O-acetyltransferase NeuD family) [Planctomycetota bacterium]|jgi:sugar O-acyltransferase (sialic acid O-acetyltransferase NeuD family)
MKDIVIIGSGGFAKEVAFLIEEINQKQSEWNILGYIDSDKNTSNGPYSVYGNDEWLMNITIPIYVVFGIGNPPLIEKLYSKFKTNKNIHFPNLIHPNVVADWKNIPIGEGNVICASNTFTTDIVIGNANIINLDCTIGHDTIIGNFNVLNPSTNISGGVKIGNLNLIGTSATVLQYLNITNNITIGAGALLTKDATEEGVYIGNPAKKR